jgi:tetratricopeptide (TPR) repeat protein
MIAPDSPRARRATTVAAVAVAMAAFYGALAVGRGFLYDDRELILDESRPEGIRDIARAFAEPYYGALPYYRPVTRLTYLAQKGLSGDRPLPFLLANAALAAFLVGSAYALLRRSRFGIEPAPALAAAALLAVHPVASSCVLPIAGRDTLLPAALMIAAVALWLTPRRAARGGALALFALALLAKEVAIATPALFLLADATDEDRPKNLAAWLRRHAPWAAIALGYVMLRSVVLAGSAVPLAPGGSALLPLASLGYGLQSSFAPYFGLFYEPELSTWLSPPRLAIALACALGVLALEGRTRNALFWLGWFVAVQLPAANLLKQETLFDERYVFPALLAPLALLAARASRATKRTAAVAAGALLLATASTTIHRAEAFGSEAAFEERWARTSPGSPNAQNGLGVVRVADGRTNEAEAAFRAALRARPGHPQALNNLGVLLLDRGDVAGATEALEAAVAGSPRYAAARYNLANARLRTGRDPEAEALYREAIGLRPRYVQAWNNLGALLAREGRTGDALGAFETVTRLDPGHVRARLNRGVLLARSGRLTEAVAAYREALAIAPGDPDAHFDLAGALAASGDRAGAIEEYRRALAARPGWPEAERALASLEAAS